MCASCWTVCDAVLTLKQMPAGNLPASTLKFNNSVPKQRLPPHGAAFMATASGDLSCLQTDQSCCAVKPGWLLSAIQQPSSEPVGWLCQTFTLTTDDNGPRESEGKHFLFRFTQTLFTTPRGRQEACKTDGYPENADWVGAKYRVDLYLHEEKMRQGRRSIQSVKRRQMEWSAKERGEWEETVAVAADVMEVGGEVKWKEGGGDNKEAPSKNTK